MSQKVIRHVLVIGGSGMLREASLWLADQGYTTSVIGRNKNKLNSLVVESPFIFPLSVDYNDLSALQKIIAESIQSRGAFDLVVAWIHKSSQKILDVIRQEIERVSDKNWQLYHILGSSDNIEEIRSKIRPTSGCDYYQIQLGFKVENERSRWLTDEEISQGVIQSIHSKTNVLVGQLEPWEKRP